MMHEQFPNWMSRVSPQADQAKLALRWNAAKAVADAADRKLAVQLSEQALGYGTGATDTLRSAARKEDTTYVTDDDALELAVLAAGAVASLMVEKRAAGETVGIALITASFGRQIDNNMHKDLLVLAEASVQEIAERARQEISFQDWTGKTISDAATKQVNATDFPSTQAGIAEIAQAVVASLKPQLQKLKEALTRLSDLQRESSDLAFLLVSGYSFVAAKPVSALTASEAAFAVADDLYQITRFPSVIPSFEAPIGALLKPAKNEKRASTLSASVSSLPAELRYKCSIKAVLYPKSLPLHFALTKCEEVSGTDAWTSAFEAMTALDASLAITAKVLSTQFYLEKILAWQLEG